MQTLQLVRAKFVQPPEKLAARCGAANFAVGLVRVMSKREFDHWKALGRVELVAEQQAPSPSANRRSAQFTPSRRTAAAQEKSAAI